MLMEHKYHPPRFFSFSMLILGQVTLSQACPAGLGKRFSQGPAGAGLEKNVKSKLGGGGYQRKARDCPDKTKESIDKYKVTTYLKFKV